MKSQERDLSSTKGTFIAIALCVALYLAWNQYLTKKYPNFGRPAQPVATDKSETAAQTTATATTPVASTLTTEPAAQVKTEPSVVAMAPSDLVFDTENITFTFAQNLGSPVSAKLKQYRLTNDKKDSDVVELFQRPAAVQAYVDKAPVRTSGLAFSGKRTENGFKFTRTDGTWVIDQTWTLPQQGYAGKLNITYTNTADAPMPLVSNLLMEVGEPTDHSQSSFFAPGLPEDKPRFLSQLDGADDFTYMEDFCKDQSMNLSIKDRKLDFFGFDTHYFAFALVPKMNASYRTAFSGKGSQTNPLCEILTVATADFGSVAPKASVTLDYDVWFGPKEVELLTAFNPHLRTTLGLGWLDMIAHPLLLAIKGLYKFTGNYGIAIIVLTILLKILFFPLTKQAAHSAARMKKLNPEMAKIKEKFKNDQQKMQMELMKFMSTHKINPMKGCLPILPTIPVFFALFRVLSASIDLRHAPFYGWITDLSIKDPFFVTPIILTGLMYLQQKLTPMTGMDPTQEKIMSFMPIIFGVMMITLPSGLVLYMLANTIMSIAQQQYLNKKFANI
jgi:YidC/Oxa1 family membrane protein insertase